MAEEEVKKDQTDEKEGANAPDKAGEAGEPEEASEKAGAPSDAAVCASGKENAEEPAEKSAEQQPAASAEPDWKLQYARLLADFDNYKKRAARDRDETYRYVESQVLRDLLPIVDNLAMAYDKAENKEDSFVKGVKLVYDGILAVLKDHEAEPFDSVGLELDTEKMEAIAHLPSSDVAAGKVSIESKKGWMLKGKVLRVAQVVVSSGKAE
ncbi:MAG: nucleotide exchange factor GrpE [Kiritimatiellia bacterium]